MAVTPLWAAAGTLVWPWLLSPQPVTVPEDGVVAAWASVACSPNPLISKSAAESAPTSAMEPNNKIVRLISGDRLSVEGRDKVLGYPHSVPGFCNNYIIPG